MPRKSSAIGDRYRAACAQDYHFFRKGEVNIVPKSLEELRRASHGLIKMDPLRTGQERMLAQFLPNIYAGKGARQDVFKARKIGSTTQWLSVFIWLCTTIDNFFAGIISMDADSTRQVTNIARRIIANMRQDVGWPEHDRKNDRFISLSNGSTLESVTAGKGENLFRGPTPFAVLCSEMASYENANETELSLINSIDLSSGIYIRESTSKGREGKGEKWYNIYLAHKEGRLRDDEVAMMFISWLDDQSNVTPNVTPQGHREASLFKDWRQAIDEGLERVARDLAARLDETIRFTDYEQKVALELNATIDQLRWYDFMLRNKSGDSPNVEDRLLFRAQENPSFIEESFVFMQGATFDTRALDAMLGKRQKAIYGGLAVKEVPHSDQPCTNEPGYVKMGDLHLALNRGDNDILEGGSLTTRLGNADVRLWRDADGKVKAIDFDPETGGQGRYAIFEPPVAGAQYFAGVDVSQGIGQDSTACVVMRRDDHMVWHESAVFNEAMLDPLSCVEDIILLLNWYFDPLCDVENNQGGALIGEMRRRHYTRLHLQERVDGATGATTQHFGFHIGGTTGGGGSRPKLIWMFKKLLRDGRIILNSETTIRQAQAMRRVNGRDDHPRGGHNDQLIAVMLAIAPTEDLDPIETGMLTPVLPHELMPKKHESFKAWDLRKYRQGKNADEFLGNSYSRRTW